jgi:hypothetical protein
MLRLHRCRNEGITVHPIRESHTESENDERALVDSERCVGREAIRFRPAENGEAEFLHQTGGAENSAARFTNDGDDGGGGGDDDGRRQPTAALREPAKGGQA